MNAGFFSSARFGAMLWIVTLLAAFTADAEPVVHWTLDVTDGEVRGVAGDCHGKLEGDRAKGLVPPGIFGSAFFFDTGKRKYKNGMGNLVYPGRDGALCASLRLENLRDGLEDYEYLGVLRDAVEQLEKADTAAARALVPSARGLLTPPSDAAAAIDDWCQDPEPLLQYRERVARMIEEVSRANVLNTEKEDGS